MNDRDEGIVSNGFRLYSLRSFGRNDDFYCRKPITALMIGARAPPLRNMNLSPFKLFHTLICAKQEDIGGSSRKDTVTDNPG